MMKKILVIQTAFIGDVILATAVIEQLNKYYPEVKLDFLLRKGNESLLKDHPFLNELIIWDKKNGMKGIGDLPGGRFDSLARDISADGSTIVGKSASSDSFNEAFIWNEENGIRGLGDLPRGNFESYAWGVSEDGSIVVGNSANGLFLEAFIWNEKNGMRHLQSVLTEEYGLDLTGWRLYVARDISDDGKTIMGRGTNPNGTTEAWIAKLN